MEPSPEPAPVELKALRRKHRDWLIAVDDDGVWYAVQKPTQTSEHFIAGPSFAQLVAQLAEVDK